MARTATKRRPNAVEQLQMKVDQIVHRVAGALTEERVTHDGEIIDVPMAAPAARSLIETVEPSPVEPFSRWLIGQAAQKRGDAVGELAKIAKGDPGFPKDGDAEAVRRRIGMAGADPDTFEALDDAEREYDRL